MEIMNDTIDFIKRLIDSLLNNPLMIAFDNATLFGFSSPEAIHNPFLRAYFQCNLVIQIIVLVAAIILAFKLNRTFKKARREADDRARQRKKDKAEKKGAGLGGKEAAA